MIRWWTRTVLEWPIRWAVAAGIIAVIAAFIGLPPRVNADLSRLLPEDEPHGQILRQEVERGGADVVYLMLEPAAGSAADSPAVQEALESLTTDLQALPQVDWASHGVPNGQQAHLAAMLAEPGMVEDLAARTKMALALGRQANSVIIQRIFGSFKPSTWATDFPFAREGTLVFQPNGGSLDPEVAEATMIEVRKTLEKYPELRLRFAGGPTAMIADSVDATRRDLMRTAWVSATLVWLVLALGMPVGTTSSWRMRFIAPAALLIPVGLGALMTLAATRLLFDALNVYTAIATSLLFGLGVDIGIHLTSRFSEERRNGHARSEAILRAWSATGPACITAAVTSAAGFLALTAASFRGIQQLGWLLALGILICLISQITLLPMLVPDITSRDRPESTPSRQTQGSRRGWWAGLVGALVLATLGVASLQPTPELDSDISRIGSADRTYDQLSEAEQLETRRTYPPIALAHPDVDSATQTSRQVQDALEAGSLPHAVAVLSADVLLPEDQSSRVAALTDLKRAVRHPAFGVLPPDLQKALTQLTDWEPAIWAVDDLPRPVRYLIDDGRRVVVVTDGPLHNMHESGRLMDALDAISGPAASEQMVQAALFRMIQIDVPTLVGVAALLVVLILMLDLRSVTWTLVAAGSLAIGIAWAWFALTWLKVPFTVANVAGVPMLLGLGVDVVLHLVHRVRESGSAREALNTAGWAAGLSTATTVVSFAALGIAESGAMRSLGHLMLVGLPTVTIASGALVLIASSALPLGDAR